MPTILIINPNSSQKTTAMMVDIAGKYVGETYRVEGCTASRAPAMIVDEPALIAAAPEVVEMGSDAASRPEVAGMVVSAFGDPGLDDLRRATNVPVTGLCEASMTAAAMGGRRFGVATTTPELVDSITAKAVDLGLAAQFTGIRLTPGDPLALTTDPVKTKQALAEATLACVREDGAEVVIIGGGPLGQAALALTDELGLPVIAPIREAVLALLALLDDNANGTR